MNFSEACVQVTSDILEKGDASCEFVAAFQIAMLFREDAEDAEDSEYPLLARPFDGDELARQFDGDEFAATVASVVFGMDKNLVSSADSDAVESVVHKIVASQDAELNLT